MNLVVSKYKDEKKRRRSAASGVTVIDRIRSFIVPCSSRSCVRPVETHNPSIFASYVYGFYEKDRTPTNFDKKSVWKKLSPNLHRGKGAKAASCAINNTLILREVFKNLPAKDLLRFRCVSSQWYRYATDALIDRKLCKFTVGGDAFFRRPTVKSTDLLRTIQNCNGFPITSVVFRSGSWDMKKSIRPCLSSQLAKFLQLQQSYCPIKSLRFDCGDRPRSFHVFEEIFSYLRTIEYLEINAVNVAGSAGEKFDFRNSLVHLKSVKFNWQEVSKNREFIHAILRAAINLERVLDFHTEIMTNAIVATNKFHAIKELYFFNNHLNLYQTLANANLQLVEFRIVKGFIYSDEIPPGALYSINKILDSSKNSLKKLCVHAIFCVLGIILPRLTNLTYLRYRFVWDQKSMFPQHVNLADHFPNLKIVNLQLENLYKKSVQKMFPWDNFRGQSVNSLPSVLELKINCGVDLHGFRAIAQLFPNLNRIRLVNTMNKFQVNKWLWVLPKSVEIIEVHGLVMEYGISIDSFVTGISEKDCKRLRSKRIKEQDVQKLTRKIALKDFTNLKQLKVFFDHRQNDKWRRDKTKSRTEPVVSKLSGLYGFLTIPSLEVQFIYDHSRPNSEELTSAFKTIRPFVKFAHAER